MPNRFLQTVFTPSVQAEQTRHGSRAGYDRFLGRQVADDTVAAALTRQEAAFIADRDSMNRFVTVFFGVATYRSADGRLGKIESIAVDSR